MKNKRKYIGIPTLEEINEQYETILNLAKDVVTFNQVKELADKYSNMLEIEVNWEPLSYYKGEEIEVIRYEYKNLLVYVDIEDGKAIPNDLITLYSDDGLQFKDAPIDKIEEEIESGAKMGLLIENDEFDKYKIVLHHVELEEGLDKSQIVNLLDKLDDDEKGYMPIEFHKNNSSAYGFITSSYYEELSFDKSKIGEIIEPVLENWDNEREDKIYKIDDETYIFMDCSQGTI